MPSIRSSVLGVALLVCLGAPTAPAAHAAKHPLDPLDAKEIDAALQLLRGAGRLGPKVLMPYLLLKEPQKAEVLAYRPGGPLRRQALAVLYDRQARRTYEVTVDLTGARMGEVREVKGAQPSVLLSEFDAVPPIVKADPRFAEAMRRRGIKDLDQVAVDAWGYGTPDSAHAQKARLLRAIAYYKGKGKNFYARPIEGWSAIVNMDERRVEKIIDTAVLPVPPVASDFDPRSIGSKRAPPKPFVITQPKGPSFTIDGTQVSWENWRFRFGMHPREGLVLYLVEYNDHGTFRPVLYRASLAEMMVPYGHSDPQWTWRAAFDEGEYGIGRYSASLEVGTDVPENARLFDARFVDDFGKPYTTPRAMALYERDGGLLWKHFDMYTGANQSRRARQLVLGFITTISNYDYGLNWIFHQDGTIELEAQLSGIMLAKGSKVSSMVGHDHGAEPDLAFGHLVAPNVIAPHHQHFFNFRIDLDVGGATGNRVVELNNQALPEGAKNPGLNAFHMTETPLKSELAAVRDLDFGTQRKWKIYNPGSVTELLHYPRGYILIPGENAPPYLRPSSPLRRRGGFVEHQVWVTQQRDQELYAAGPYPAQRAESDGLPDWVKRNASLEGQDLVLWYTFCVSHAPRPEEWPVMSVHRTGFKLVPAGFFDRNPALDVPR